MKKIIFLTIFTMLLMSVSAGAASVEPWGNLEDDIIRITGTEAVDKKLTILVINPGYEEADAWTDGENAIQIYAKTNAKDGSFVFDIPMYDANGDGGGEYKYVISNGTSAERGSFSFYFYQAKIDIIEDINNLDDVTDLVDAIYATYSLNGSDVFQSTPKGAISSIIKETENFPLDPDNMKIKLNEALCLAAYSEGVSKLSDGGYLKYADILGIEDTDLYTDYKTLLSAEGRDAVNSNVIGKKLRTVSGIAKEFEDQTLLRLISQNKDDGYGHVESILNKYKEKYEDAGIIIKKITSTGREYDIFRMMSESSATSLTQLKKEVESAIKKYSKTENGGGGGGGGGGGSASGTLPGGGSAISDPVLPEDGFVERKDSPFEDIESVSWANESIGVLYNRGIISGKSATEFFPNDNITRAEFTKLVVASLFGTPDGSGTKFSDVSGWSVPYVAFASDNGIVNGVTDSLFSPNGDISREQAMTILSRALNKKGYEGIAQTKTFSDDSSISEWAKEAVYTLAGAGVVSGKGNNMFCPKDNLTRAEAAKIIYFSLNLTEEVN